MKKNNSKLKIRTQHSRIKNWKFAAATIIIFIISQKIFAATNYVSKTGGHVSPFTNWANAATNIQAAVDAATSGDIVLVTNGTYYPADQINVTKDITVKSVNGAKYTIVDGGFPTQTSRCFSINGGDTIDGFTIKNGYTTENGGGVQCVSGGTVRNSIVRENSTSSYGGGVYGGTIQNSIISGNSAKNGGGVNRGTVQNCTISGNSAKVGGGVDICTVRNSIVYYNYALVNPNFSGSFEYNCIASLSNGIGNIPDTPKLLDSGHIASDSPCISSGNTNFASGFDIDGDAWQQPPAIGCDQPVSGTKTGELAISIFAVYNRLHINFSNYFTATIFGEAESNCWDFGDGTTLHNELGAYYFWSNTGTYKVVLTAFNETYPAGISDTVLVEVAEKQVHYVNINNSTPAVPYTTWDNAATNIQDAINAAAPYETVLVTNGVYYIQDEITVTKGLTVISVNGAEETIVDGNKTCRCFYLDNDNPTIDGFTIRNGKTTERESGAGVLCDRGGIVRNCIIIGNSSEWMGGGAACVEGGSVSNCIIKYNSASDYWGGGVYCYYGGAVRNSLIAYNSADHGGGVICFAKDTIVEQSTIISNTAINGGGVYCEFGGTARNCLIIGNSAEYKGGGVCCHYEGYVQSCTIAGNSADEKGGGIGIDVFFPEAEYYVENCIIWGNKGSPTFDVPNCTNRFNCIRGWTGGEEGVIASSPRFLSSTDYRLESSSPCINAGTNMSWMWLSTDLEGNPRIIDNTVDMGAYEIGALGCSFIADKTRGLPPLDVEFTAYTYGTNTEKVYFSWDFNNDDIFDFNNITNAVSSYIYTNEGIFSVYLSVSNNIGEVCYSYRQLYIEIIPEPMGLLIFNFVFLIYCLKKNRHELTY